MAEYKVAQDVEADDKLIGPFSFRQFIYLIVVAGASAIAGAGTSFRTTRNITPAGHTTFRCFSATAT